MLSTRRQLELMRDLQRLANERQLAEERIARDYDAAVATAHSEWKRRTQTAETDYQSSKSEEETSHASRIAALTSQFEAERNATQAEYRQVRESVERKYETTIREAKEHKKQSLWQALAIFDAAKNNPREALEAVQEELAGWRRELGQLEQDAVEILSNRRLWHPPSSPPARDASDEPGTASKPKNIAEAKAGIAEQLESIRTRIANMQDDRVSQVFEGSTPAGILLGIWLLLVVGLGFAAGWGNLVVWLTGSVLGTVVVGGLGGWLLRKRLRAWAEDTYGAIAADLSAAQGQIEMAAIVAREKSRRDAEQLLAVRDREIAEAESSAAKTLTDIESWKETSLAEANETYPATLAELRAAHQRETEVEQTSHRKEMAAITSKVEAEKRAADAAKQQALTAAEEARQSAWQAMRDAWFAGFEELQSELEDMATECRRLFPDWNETSYEHWPKPTTTTDAIQFGTATLALPKVKHAISSDPALRPTVRDLPIPTLITLREQPSLVISAEGEMRSRAVELLQTTMVRFLTAMPPGKVRFTVCDPVSLGESFSSFMHLADYDEGLIHGRIWSESRDIDEQLLRLTGHMETILQKYLRNEYSSIHEYNAQAGEVAEPFQVLAIANFPHGFSDAAARRLLSLVTGGPRCGIYVLLSHDKKQRLPNDFALDDLLAAVVHIDWDTSREAFVWRYPAFEHLPLQLAEPIGSPALVRLMKQAGKQAKESIRVEVPFDVVVPEPGGWWEDSCDRELSIPVGRAGANRLQHVRLGKGTAQHLLVAGKTGSGKSTFLHALVTSGALRFSPEELEFYLIDFKKGVEFKSYATHRLPHARVIAIESEREFGLSVLERLDLELRRRGEKFRTAGVQGLADYRAEHPDDPMPRVLLVVDEFQELFVEDDKLAQEAGLLLDRLVRQGRAFGMHVLLGSQTLSGAYSLARSTLGQMAVRVALECSESDAHLILSDERNQAARFLSRPGEAIYNDQNGLVAANQPFQVVWLSDRQRGEYLAEINQLRQARGLAENEPIVFEGNAPADARNNAALAALLDGSLPADPRGEAWIGSAVAIKPPTSLTFARHGGSNLMLVGQQPAAALGVLTTAVVSLAAGARGNGASFVILDGSRPGEVGEGLWGSVAEMLGERAELIADREVPEAIGQIAAELARRDQQGDESAAAIYLVIYNAARFRDLRKSEDDFSFSMDADKPPATDKQLAEILKNGPQWGIHTLVWCDGYNAVTRLFDRLAMREFEMRVAFQMSAADSSNLLDTPAASTLSQHRALLYNDETGESEKFRPYGLPSDEWLAEVAAALGRRKAVDQPAADQA